jgi:hypothetical protein
VDLAAGSSAAHGPCFFGYRSPLRQRVALSLPGEGNFLRPLERKPGPQSTFMTPTRYAAIPGRAALDDVLMRATLKQFAGYWHGEIQGGIRADLTVDRATGRLLPASWLANDLPATLAGGVLLFIDPRQDDGGVPRAAGLTRPHPLASALVDSVVPDLKEAPPAVSVLAVRIPPIKTGEQLTRLGADEYAACDERLTTWLHRPPRERTRSTLPDLPTLHAAQLEWGGWALARGTAPSAVFLASTRNYFLHNATADDYKSVARPLRTEGVPNLDISHWLLPGQALLLAWSDEPGPATLHYGGSPMPAWGGLTIYRVRLALSYEGVPPPQGSAP